jgi:hypothetical protein
MQRLWLPASCGANSPEFLTQRVQHGLCDFGQGGSRLYHAQGLPGEQTFHLHLRLGRLVGLLHPVGHAGFPDLHRGRITVLAHSGYFMFGLQCA